ncbi:MAG: Alternative RNA polymerase sigma factor SigE [uncultured Pyrinomonadaceae bacterium]|uniref:Alternative RNA polymerase sigma factor SigE n=1 Tax=uncultured Pyrinomonadaceae bacterium TaxID=2283094 RepID=A0A6J4NYY9_9BACT|nr:MAG: Alternative RNA polymerase sigma factor SigE [uncultured Pyrinomonadaceae bacterium]
MFFEKSMTFGEEEFSEVALAAGQISVRSSVEIEFIERLKIGEADAFDALVIRYSADVYAVLFRLTQDAEEAADLTQETFLSALKAIKKFRGEADLKTWLVRIAINESRNRFRWWTRRRREKTVSLDAPVGEQEMPLSETVSSNFANPEETILQRERENRLQKALGDLPEIFREAVVLCDIEGLSYEEIAAALEINIGTVKSRIARGREELRRKLNDI